MNSRIGVCIRPSLYIDLNMHIYIYIYIYIYSTWLVIFVPTHFNGAGSISEDIIGIFHWRNPSSRTMALGSTHPLTDMNTRNISLWVKAAGAWGWQPYHLHVPIVKKSGSVNLLEPTGPVQACTRIALPLPLPLHTSTGGISDWHCILVTSIEWCVVCSSAHCRQHLHSECLDVETSLFSACIRT